MAPVTRLKSGATPTATPNGTPTKEAPAKATPRRAVSSAVTKKPPASAKKPAAQRVVSGKVEKATPGKRQASAAVKKKEEPIDECCGKNDDDGEDEEVELPGPIPHGCVRPSGFADLVRKKPAPGEHRRRVAEAILAQYIPGWTMANITKLARDLDRRVEVTPTGLEVSLNTGGRKASPASEIIPFPRNPKLVSDWPAWFTPEQTSRSWNGQRWKDSWLCSSGAILPPSMQTARQCPQVKNAAGNNTCSGFCNVRWRDSHLMALAELGGLLLETLIPPLHRVWEDKRVNAPTGNEPTLEARLESQARLLMHDAFPELVQSLEGGTVRVYSRPNPNQKATSVEFEFNMHYSEPPK